MIDPKPLAAEREFAVAPIVRSPELGHSKRETVGRLDRLCAELGLDRERARGWTIVQTAAWAEGAVNHTRTVELAARSMIGARALFDVDSHSCVPTGARAEGYTRVRER